MTSVVIPPVPLRLRSLVGELTGVLGACRTALEIGCGVDSPLIYLADRLAIEGLDIHEPALEACRQLGFLRAYHLASAMELEERFDEDSFDAVVALDLIEHLDKEDGYRLLEMMRRVARKRVVLFTPNGFVPQSGDSNPWMEHRSGWTVQDFQSAGFDVVGLHGWKGFRGPYARLKFRPRVLWGAVSELTHWIWTRRHPEAAYSLLAVRELKGQPDG